MLYIIGAIFSSTFILVMFRLFPRFGVNNLFAILVNYIVATFLCLSFSKDGFSGFLQVVYASWFPLALINGFLFITLFNLFALSSQKVGLAITSVANKMSVVIPVVIAIILYSESIHFRKGAGLAMALIAFYFTLKKNEVPRFDRKYLYLPIILFLGGGISDSLLNYVMKIHLDDIGIFSYLSVVFGSALLLGAPVFAVKFIKNPPKKSGTNVIAGILLGLMNFASTWFFMGALGLVWMEGSVFIPIFNASIVTLGGLSGILFFSEKMSRINMFGFILAILSILIIAS